MNKACTTGLLSLFMIVSSFIPANRQEQREIAFIDNEGRSGMLSGTFAGEKVEILRFLSETETGSYEEVYSFAQNELNTVKVEEVVFNRPKFWTEALARANDDDEWYDPSKSKTVQLTYHFSEGAVKYWEDSEGTRSYPVNRRLRKAGEIYLDKAEDYLLALEK